MADPVLYGYSVYKGSCAASQSVDLTNLLDESGANIGPALGGQFTTIHIFISSNADRAPAATGYAAVMDAIANDTNDLMLWAGYKFQPSTPDTSITVTCSVSSGSSLIAIARVWDNVDATTPLDVASVNNTGINTAIPNPGSATPATTGAMFVFGSGCAHTDGVRTLSESYMDWSFADSRDGSFDLSVLVGHKAGGVASTPYDGAALTWSGTDSNAFSHASNVMVLRPAPSGGDVVESITATDAQSVTLDLAAARTEAITAADAQGAAIVADVAVSENVTATDTPAGGLGFDVATSEAITASDLAAGSLIRVGSVTDSASPAATEAATMFCPAGVTEAGTATETEAVVLVMSAAVTETASATESGDATVAAGGTGDVVEAATATEAQSATVIMGVSGVEATTATEAVAASNVMSVAVAETASSAATQAASAALSAGASETASATSTQAAGLLAVGSATEAATATAIEAVIIPSAAEALFAIRGRWAIPSIAGDWHQPSITGAWAIPSIAGEWKSV